MYLKTCIAYVLRISTLSKIYCRRPDFIATTSHAFGSNARKTTVEPLSFLPEDTFTYVHIDTANLFHPMR